jgi:hypothetical protein
MPGPEAVHTPGRDQRSRLQFTRIAELTFSSQYVGKDLSKLDTANEAPEN